MLTWEGEHVSTHTASLKHPLCPMAPPAMFSCGCCGSRVERGRPQNRCQHLRDYRQTQAKLDRATAYIRRLERALSVVRAAAAGVRPMPGSSPRTPRRAVTEAPPTPGGIYSSAPMTPRAPPPNYQQGYQTPSTFGPQAAPCTPLGPPEWGLPAPSTPVGRSRTPRR